uniref:Uncharacterized protein n=1 Tax=mine drainage metagenome TaxID=410659 RepID=E6Q4I1_9ZZZZ
MAVSDRSVHILPLTSIVTSALPGLLLVFFRASCDRRSNIFRDRSSSMERFLRVGKPSHDRFGHA